MTVLYIGGSLDTLRLVRFKITGGSRATDTAHINHYPRVTGVRSPFRFRVCACSARAGGSA